MDARRTNRDIAAAVGVAPTTSLDRMKALRERGVIIGARLDLAEIGRPVQALVAVPDNEHLYAFVIDRLTEKPEVADVRTSIVYEHIRAATVMPARTKD